MATDEEKLLVRIEASQRKFERQMAAIAKSADRNSSRAERSWRRSNRRAARSFERLRASADRSLGGVRRLALAAAGALGTREIARYADAWTEVENKLRAASQISGRQARSTDKLNDLATETRSGLEETVDLYAKLLRSTADVAKSELEVARATEIVNKAFKAGGAAASEQAAGILQLSQGLASGLLQGDELRSVRENAPLVAQAIANEFKTTIGGLKELGAEGEITAARVFKAILASQADVEAAFAKTNPTIRDGFTILRNGLTEAVGGFAKGSGAAEGFAGTLSELGEFLANNASAAERLGAKFAEAFKIMNEDILGVRKAFFEMTDGLDGSEASLRDFVLYAIEALKTVISSAAGVGAAIAQAMLEGVSAVANGATAIVNGAISAIEGLLNGVIFGINKMIKSINVMVDTANKIPGVDVGGFSEIGNFNLGRFDSPISADDQTVLGAYKDAVEGTEKALEDLGETAVGVYRRIARAGETPGDTNDPRGNQIGGLTNNTPGRTRPKIETPASTGGGKSKKPDEPFFQDIERQIVALERQFEMLGKTTGEVAALTAKYKLLDEAKKRGLELDKVYTQTGETLREEIDRQSEAIGRLADEYEAAEQRAQMFETMKNDLLDAIVAGEDLTGVMQSLAQAIARAALQAALFGEGPFSDLFGGSGKGIIGSIIPGFASGTNSAPGGVALVGERGPELVNLPKGSQVIPAPQTATMLRSQSQPSVSVQQGDTHVRAVIVDNPNDRFQQITQLPSWEREIMVVVNRNRMSV